MAARRRARGSRPAPPRGAAPPARPSSMPRSCSLSAVTGADAPEPLDRQRVQERRARRRAAPPAGRRAWPPRSRPWRGTWCVATPTVIGRPTALAHVAPQPARDLARRAGDPLAARGRRGTPRRSRAPRPAAWSARRPEHRPARLGVGRHPRPHDHRLRTQPAGLRAPHRRPDPAAPSPRSSPQAPPPPPTITGRPRKPRIVALLHRGIERVEIGVQDRRLELTQTYVRTPRGRDVCATGPM